MVHWRETAKTCQKCENLRPSWQFVGDLKNCSKCEWETLIHLKYRQCQYCKRWTHGQDSKICVECTEKARQKHFEKRFLPTRLKHIEYLCIGCLVNKSCNAFLRETNVCRSCVRKKQQISLGNKQCKSCCCWRNPEEMTTKKHCYKCIDRCRKNTSEGLKRLRKNPEWREYYRQYSRHYYWNVFKIVYNQVLAVQWAHGLSKKRKINRNGFWHVLNHSLFTDFRRNYKKWETLTTKVINEMKHGSKRVEWERERKESIEELWKNKPHFSYQDTHVS